jgi:hypothetical protein
MLQFKHNNIMNKLIRTQFSTIKKQHCLPVRKSPKQHCLPVRKLPKQHYFPIKHFPKQHFFQPIKHSSKRYFSLPMYPQNNILSNTSAKLYDFLFYYFATMSPIAGVVTCVSVFGSYVTNSINWLNIVSFELVQDCTLFNYSLVLFTSIGCGIVGCLCVPILLPYYCSVIVYDHLCCFSIKYEEKAIRRKI